MKKGFLQILCSLLILSMMLSLTPVSFAAAQTDITVTKTYLSQNFTGATTEKKTVADPSDTNVALDRTKITVASGANFSNSYSYNHSTSAVDDALLFEINVSKDAETYGYFHFGTNTDNYIVTDFRVKVPSYSGATNKCMVELTAINGSSWQRMVRLSFAPKPSGDAVSFSMRIGGEKSSTDTTANNRNAVKFDNLVTLKQNEWIDFRVIADETEKKCHLLINGALICTDLPYTSLVTEGAKYGALSVGTDYGGGMGKIYFDDLSVYGVDAASVAAMLLDGADNYIEKQTFTPPVDRTDGYPGRDLYLPSHAKKTAMTQTFVWGNGVKFPSTAYFGFRTGSDRQEGALTTAPAYKMKLYQPNAYNTTHDDVGSTAYPSYFTPTVTVGDVTVNNRNTVGLKLKRKLMADNDADIEVGVPQAFSDSAGGYISVAPNGTTCKKLTELTTTGSYYTRTAVTNIGNGTRTLLCALCVYKYDNIDTIFDVKKVELAAGEREEVVFNTLDHDEINDYGTTAKILFIDAQTLMPITNQIVFSSESGVLYSYDNGKLTLYGVGEMSSYTAFSQTPWSALADEVVEIEIQDGVTSVTDNSLSGFTNLGLIEISEDVETIGENALPDSDFTVKGNYHSAAEEYAQNNGKDFILSELRILSIGNSHTIDYSKWRNDIQNDLYAAGLDTTITHSTVVYGGRQLYREDSDRLSHLKVGTDTTHEGYSLYNNQLNSSKTWDLIIIQDWHESSRDDNDEHFTDGLSAAVEWIKGRQPQAKVAWVMDWADKNSYSFVATDTLESVYNNIVSAMADVEKMTENKPDYIIPMGTAIQNARSSYLGTVNNAKDAYSNWSNTDWAWNKNASNPESYLDTYSVFERDSTHCSYELGRYTAGAAVYANIYEIFKNDLDVSEGFDFYGALKTAPVTADAETWKGDFTSSIWNIIKESARNAIVTKGAVTQSAYTVDPANEIASAIEAADYTNVDFGDLSAVAAAVNTAADNKITATAANISVGGDSAAVTFLYGYTKKTVTISK